MRCNGCKNGKTSWRATKWVIIGLKSLLRCIRAVLSEDSLYIWNLPRTATISAYYGYEGEDMNEDVEASPGLHKKLVLGVFLGDYLGVGIVLFLPCFFLSNLFRARGRFTSLAMR